MMDPVAGKRPAEPDSLSTLVLVVREDEVLASTVQVESLAEKR
jgi:hypothetical protein